MANGYFEAGMKDQICYFDVFYRNVPDNGGFAIAAGLEQIIQYINNYLKDGNDLPIPYNYKNKESFGDAW